MSDDFERTSIEDGLQTSLHHATGRICEQLQEQQGVTFGREFVAMVSDLAFRQAGLFAEDLEAFAKHAKRTTVNAEDVKLLVRRSKSLHDHISKMVADNSPSTSKGKAKK